MHMYAKYQMYVSWIKSHGQWWTELYLAFDIEGWPWPYKVTNKNVWLYKMHKYTQYQMHVCIGSKVKANVKVSG